MTAWVRADVADNHCPEARLVGGEVHLRDSRHPDGPVLAYATAPQWPAFCALIATGRDPWDVTRTPTGVRLAGHDTHRRPAGLVFTAAEWDAFCDGVRAGGFDAARLAAAEVG